MPFLANENTISFGGAGRILRPRATTAAAPLAPTALSATAGNAQVSLTWTAPASNGGASISDYTVQYSSDSGSTWTTFSRAASAATSATVTGLVNGTPYQFRVAAVNIAGTGPYTGVNPTVSPRTAPNAPTSLAATAGDTQVVLSWNAPASDGGASITDYVVEFSSNSGSTWTTFSRAASTATTATVTGLTNGTAYVFRVAAVNVAGTGAYATTAGSATPSAPVSVSPLHLANGFLSTLRNDTVTASEFPNAALASGYLSVLRVSDTISDAEFPNAALGNGFLHVLSVDPVPSGPTVTGGTVTTPGDGYTYRTFTSGGDLVISGASLTCDVLVVGGGASGGGGGYWGGGGGGGGGVSLTSGTSLSAGTYPVTVAASASIGNNGGSSSISTFSASGGLIGGVGDGAGGGGGGSSGLPTSSSASTRNSGGSRAAGANEDNEAGGGGGGAGGAGGNASASNGGTGGVGRTVFGVTYGAGGRGGFVPGSTTTNGAANTGNGGSGARQDNIGRGTGGSGIVIVRYLSP